MTVLRVDTIAASGQTSENTGSVFFDGTGDYLSIATNNDTILGSTYTVECWIYLNDISSRNAILESGTGINNAGSFGLYHEILAGPQNIIRIRANSTGNDVDTGSIVVADEWVHIAASVNNNFARIFVNGILEGSGNTNGSVTSTINQIGGLTGFSDYDFDGYISNVRVVKGRALYTSNFTPPTRELEVTPETVLVACYDGENIFAEKTGKIIAAYGDRLSSPTPTATDSPIGITTNYPPVTRGVDVTAGPTLDGDLEFNSQNFFVLPKGTTTEQFPNFAGVDSTSARGVFIMGRTGPTSQSNVIDYITISTLGNAQDFGDSIIEGNYGAGASSSTRGLSAGGDAVGNQNLIQYITISSTGNGQDFGDLTDARYELGGASNSTRGLFAGGTSPAKVNLIEFVTIATTGNAFDFGDLTLTRSSGGGLASPTRALFGGGYVSPARRNTIDYVNISSTGNAVDFGDLTEERGTDNGGASSQTRGLWMGGFAPAKNTIDYVEIPTLGNAIDFGNLTGSRGLGAAVSSKIRAVLGGGLTTDSIDYVTIATTGDATDYGDLTVGRYGLSGVSNGHGGLG